MRALGSGRPSKVILEIKRLVERQMRLDDETTATQLHLMLISKGYTTFHSKLFYSVVLPSAGPLEAAHTVN